MVSRTKTLSKLWTDRCDVYVSEQVEDLSTGRIIEQERRLHQEIPCRLSFRRGIEAMGMLRDIGDAAMEAVQVVRLFLAPDIDISAGCRIVVRRGDGSELRFRRSGVPAVFESHQEIRMEREERFV